MVITKTVHEIIPASQSKSGLDTENSYQMYYKVGCGWVAMIDSASKFTTDEQVTHWLDVAVESVKDNQFLNVLELN